MSFNSVITQVIYTNQIPAAPSFDFINHSYDYRPNWTPLNPMTITDICDTVYPCSALKGTTGSFWTMNFKPLETHRGVALIITLHFRSFYVSLLKELFL